MNPLWRPFAVLLRLGAACLGQAAVPENWYVRNSPATNDLNVVAFGNGFFLAAGTRGALLTSSNGIDWSGSHPAGSVPTFTCSTYGSFYSYGPRSLYLVAGSGTALIVGSADLVSWTNELSGDDSQQIYGMANGSGAFEAVARDPAANRSYFLFSTTGNTWQSNALPTTQTVRAIAAAAAPVGVGGLPGAKFVAVGDSGTILISPDGLSWAAGNSGTTTTLRAAVYHQGRMFAGGDGGFIVSSIDGTNWSAAASTSFDIRGLASSGNALVAVGDHLGSGRLQVSLNGLTWPGSALTFSNSLDAVTYGESSFVATGGGGLIVQSSSAPGSTVNSWVNTNGGYWEEPNWSCGRLPAPDQDLIAFTNAGWKVLAIGSNTTANFASSLTVNALDVAAPANSFNELLLNYAGTNVPLRVNSMTVGSNAWLLSFNSALDATWSLTLNAPASFSAGSLLSTRDCTLGASLVLADSAASIYVLHAKTNGMLTQLGGTYTGEALMLDGGSSGSLLSGVMNAGQLCVGAQAEFIPIYLNGGVGTFVQADGTVTAYLLALGNSGYIEGTGYYFLQGGSVEASQIRIAAGEFSQGGGRVTVGQMELPEPDGYGQYTLSDGVLLSSNLSLGFMSGIGFVNYWVGDFIQSGGAHTNGSMSLIGYLFDPNPGGTVYHLSAGSYELQGGVLQSGEEDVAGGSFSQSGGTNVTPSLVLSAGGTYVLANGLLSTANLSFGGYEPILWGPDACSGAQIFVQQGGRVTVVGALVMTNFAGYELQAGMLAAQDIEVGPGSGIACETGIVSNWGTLTLQGGAFYAGSQSHWLGQLRILPSPQVCYNPPAAVIDLTGPAANVVRFGDSHLADWSGGPLKLLGWSGNAGIAHRVYFGTSSSGLTPAQLSQILFVNPAGWPAGSYPARILDTGEIIPGGPPPPITLTRSPAGLILSWPGSYQLLSATNILGPYTAVPGGLSPMTNTLTAPQQFFRLAVPGP